MGAEADRRESVRISLRAECTRNGVEPDLARGLDRRFDLARRISHARRRIHRLGQGAFRWLGTWDWRRSWIEQGASSGVDCGGTGKTDMSFRLLSATWFLSASLYLMWIGAIMAPRSRIRLVWDADKAEP